LISAEVLALLPKKTRKSTEYAVYARDYEKKGPLNTFFDYISSQYLSAFLTVAVDLLRDGPHV
jgi:hypothetical protein